MIVFWYSYTFGERDKIQIPVELQIHNTYTETRPGTMIIYKS